MTYTNRNNNNANPIDEHERLKKVLHGSDNAVQWQLPGQEPENEITKSQSSTRKTK